MGDMIPGLIENWSYLAVGLLMFLETVFPPIPSEIIMPLAGVEAAQNEASLLGMILAGTLGALLGNAFWFGLAWYLGLDRFEQFIIRHGRFFTMDQAEIDRGRKLFDHYGGGIVGFGRMIPLIRSLVSIPAGLVHMNAKSFFIYTALGTFIWTMGLTVAGFLLGQRFTEVDKILGPISTGVLFTLLMIYFYRVATWNRRKNGA